MSNTLDDLADRYHSNLSDKGRTYWHKRGVTDDWLDTLKIGELWKGSWHWFTIPIIDHEGTCHFFKYKKTPWGDVKQPPALTAPAGPKAALFPFPYLEDRIQQFDRCIFLAEGEPDCLCLLSQGLPAVTCTHGAGTWRDEFKGCFRGDITVVCAYDKDKAGDDGARMLRAWFTEHLPTIEFLRFPFPADFEGKDITDYYLQYGKLP